MSQATESAISLARGPLIGTFLGLVLYGVTCIQTLFYFRTYYEHDGLRLKFTVAFLLILETAHAAMTILVMDDELIVHYGDISFLESQTWPSASMYILGLLIDFYVYLYFTWRIWLFTKSTWVSVFMGAISISRTAISIVSCVLSMRKQTWSEFLDSARTLLIIGNMLFIAGDTFSACAMAYHLTKYKSWAAPTRPRPRIDILLNRLLTFCVATGALICFVDIIALIFTLTQPRSNTFTSGIIIQVRLYANSLLASLNIRNATSRAYEDDQPVELAAISLRFAPPSDLSTVSEGSPRAHLTKSSGVESWQTTELPSRTLPQV